MNRAKAIIAGVERPRHAAGEMERVLHKGSDDEEDKFKPWEPSDNTKDTLESLIEFSEYRREDSKPMKKKEIAVSFKNFDRWLDEEVNHLYAIAKEKDDQLFE